MTDELNKANDLDQYRATYGVIVDEYGAASNNLDNTWRSSGRAVGNRQFLNEDSDVHVGSEYTKKDFDYFRPAQRIAKQPKLIIKMCMEAYDNVGILKNTIDLMGDFASKGVTIVHKNKKVEKFLRQWFRMVKGTQVTERIANNFYRGGNVIIEQINGKIKPSTEQRWKQVGFIEAPVKKNDIPRQYTIHNPMTIEKVGSYLSTERDRFFLNTTADQISNVNIFTGTATSQRLDKGIVELDQNRVFDYYYKKDDWELWAKPMTYAIMNELMMLDKVQLADISALDGAISNIRLWKLGSFEHNIYPNREAINKVRRILSNRNGGGVIDLVWGPELDFKESNTEVHKFLGKEKYEAILTLIYAGLGIPPTMTGGGGASGGGFTNNMVSIKTLVERLQYGRDILTDFWEAQLSQVMRAMGFSGVARLVFTHNALSDEAAEKKLLVDLVDRDIVSSDSVRSVFGFDPEIEQFKVNREARSRGVSTPDKVSPFHVVQPEHELKKIALNNGIVTPGEVGVDLDDRNEGEESMVEINQKNAENNKKAEVDSKPKGAPGRPMNAKDDRPRKKATVKPRSVGFVTDLMFCEAAREAVSKIVNPGYLKSVGKSNLRKLTKDEYLTMERVKFHCIAHILDSRKGDPTNFDVNLDTVKAGIDKGDHPKYTVARELVEEFTELYSKAPSIDDMKQIYLVSLTGE
jgi:hypothetical protein